MTIIIIIIIKTEKNAWLKGTETVAMHAQAKRDIPHSVGHIVQVYPI